MYRLNCFIRLPATSSCRFNCYRARDILFLQINESLFARIKINPLTSAERRAFSPIDFSPFTSNIPDSTPFPVSGTFILSVKPGGEEGFCFCLRTIPRRYRGSIIPLSLATRQRTISISLLTLNSSSRVSRGNNRQSRSIGARCEQNLDMRSKTRE